MSLKETLKEQMIVSSITKEDYLTAKSILQQAEEAKAVIEKFEEQEKWAEDPIQMIMETGKVEFVAGERIRNTEMLWRATELKYTHEKGVVQRIITYSTETEAKNLLGISTDETKLI